MIDLRSYIRTVPDWPKPGIQFRDITSLVNHPVGFRAAVEGLAELARPHKPDRIVAIESRGFIFGACLARELGTGLVLVRKLGKLPAKTIQERYDLEYGSATVEMHTDAVHQGERCVIVDDLVATGGTVLAAAALVRRLGGVVTGCVYCIDLPDLGGRKRLEADGIPCGRLMEYEGD